jgi:hypothetical protein
MVEMDVNEEMEDMVRARKEERMCCGENYEDGVYSYLPISEGSVFKWKDMIIAMDTIAM